MLSIYFKGIETELSIKGNESQERLDKCLIDFQIVSNWMPSNVFPPLKVDHHMVETSWKNIDYALLDSIKRQVYLL